MATHNLQNAPSVTSASLGAPLAPSVRRFEPSIAERWDRFVLEHPRGTFFHQVGWKHVIEKTFHYQPWYFYAERRGKITGVAPLFLVSNWVVGRCLLSVPLAVYGGICAVDTESEQTLLNHAKQLALSLKVDFLELRNRNGGLLPEFRPNPRYATFTAELSPDPEENRRRLPKDTRYMIRKAEKAGLWTQRGLHQMGEFYTLFALSMQRLGTPVYPRTLFDNFAQEFPDRMDVHLVYAGNKPVAGALCFFFRQTILPYYAGAGPEAPPLAANNFLYWSLMKEAAQAGIRHFDFGRSKKGTGSYAFKMQWNMKAELLDYQIYLVRRKTVPNFSPLNPKFAMAARLWRRVPLWLATRIGPRVVRWFP